ncbi:MAG: ROK family protein [Flexilinea sp.]
MSLPVVKPDPQKREAMTRYAIGIDSGGTNIRVGLVSDDGKLIRIRKENNIGVKTLQFDVCIRQITRMVDEFLQSDEVKNLPLIGIGIGSSGQINKNGELFGHNRAPDFNFKTIPVQAMLQEQFAMKVKVINDSQAAIYGEGKYGAGKGFKDIVGFTVGTGIGGAVIIDGKICRGAIGLAGHLGFLIINYDGDMSRAGVPGVVEDIASGTGITNIARYEVQKSPERGMKILLLSEGKIEKITCPIVFAAARSGDPLANEIIERCGTALGYAAASMIHAVNPEIIILAGGVAEQGELLLNPVRKVVENHVIWTARRTPVEKAKLGEYAGVIGAAALMFSQVDEEI